MEYLIDTTIYIIKKFIQNRQILLLCKILPWYFFGGEGGEPRFLIIRKIMRELKNKLSAKYKTVQ